MTKPRMRSRAPTPQETNRAPITNSVPATCSPANTAEVTGRFEPVLRDRLALELIKLINPLEDTFGRTRPLGADKVCQLVSPPQDYANAFESGKV